MYSTWAFLATHRVPYIRWDKLNSQFIVTKFSILHAGGSDFKPVKRARKAMLELEIAVPPTRVLEGAGPKCHTFTV